MRSWLFHPAIFFPITFFVAGAIIWFSLSPQSWPRDPAPQSGRLEGGSIILEASAFDAPDPSPEQVMYIDRDVLGRARSLAIAVLPEQPRPTPAETGVRILLKPEVAALLSDRRVHVEIAYRPKPLNNADEVALSLQGIGPAEWVSAPLTPEGGVVLLVLPPQFAVDAIGLRAISAQTDQNYGLEILRIKLDPQ